MENGTACHVCLAFAATGTALGVTAIIFCVIQAFIMARLFRKLSKFMHLNKLKFERKSRKMITEEDAETGSLSPAGSNQVPPALCMLPMTPHQQRVEYPSTASNSLKSFSSDSATEDLNLPSPTVAELKQSLALPLKKVYGKSSTLDSRITWGVCDKESETLTDIRPRALTSNALMSPDKSVKLVGTPTDQSGPESLAGTPGSSGSPCRNPLAYIVTEIVDVKGSKKRPSVRLRESRPKRQLSDTLQKQLEEPDNFYFTLEKQTPDKEVGPEEHASTPSPTKRKEWNKIWRQVLPVAGGMEPTSLKPRDENENNFLTSPEKKSPTYSSESTEAMETKHKAAMKPPTARKNRPPLVEASSPSLHRGGTWSPRTLERQRMMLGEPSDGKLSSAKRTRAGSLRERFPRPASPYEQVQAPIHTSAGHPIICAENPGCYSKIVRQPDGRRRASSIGSSDILEVQSDRSYNTLVVGV